MKLLPPTYARLLVQCARTQRKVKDIARILGVSPYVVYRLLNMEPTIWTVAMQSQLESLVPDFFKPEVERLKASHEDMI